MSGHESRMPGLYGSIRRHPVGVLLYLHGLSTGDFVPALEQFLGSAAGLSSATVSRLTAQWTEDHKAFQARDLSKTDFVYVWANGVHPKVRLDEARACVLVMVGVSRR